MCNENLTKDAIRIEVVKDGILYVAEAVLPSSTGYYGQMSFYSLLQPRINILLWRVAKDMANEVAFGAQAMKIAKS